MVYGDPGRTELHEAQKLVGRGEDPDAAAARAQHLIDQMTTAFDDALVENWEPLDGTFGLPDPDDEHVVAAALVGGADVIVTSNLKDFPLQRIPDPLKVASPRTVRRRHGSGLSRRRTTCSGSDGDPFRTAAVDRLTSSSTAIIDRYRWSKQLNSSAARLELAVDR